MSFNFMSVPGKAIISKNSLFEFFSNGMLVKLEVDRDRNIIRFRTTVFSEVDFIPFAIRDCVFKLFEKSSNKKYPTLLELDEENSRVDLIQELDGRIDIPLLKLLKLFTFVARSWSSILKKVSDNDLQNI